MKKNLLIKLRTYELIFNTYNRALSIENIEDLKKRWLLFNGVCVMFLGTYPPFMPPNHGMPADIPTSYSNGIGALHNNISPNNIAFNHRNLFQGDPHANPAHAAHIRPALGNSAGGKP